MNHWIKPEDFQIYSVKTFFFFHTGYICNTSGQSLKSRSCWVNKTVKSHHFGKCCFKKAVCVCVCVCVCVFGLEFIHYNKSQHRKIYNSCFSVLSPKESKKSLKKFIALCVTWFTNVTDICSQAGAMWLCDEWLYVNASQTEEGFLYTAMLLWSLWWLLAAP